MTKSQELIVIEEFVKRLGPDSYLGPVLKAQLPWIESAIRSDMPPDINIVEATKAVGEAHAEAAKIIAEARASADRIVADATKHAARMNEEVSSARVRLNLALAKMKEASSFL